MSKPPRSDPPGQTAGWRAFALGMIGMFAVIAIWIALVETAETPEVEPMSRSQSTVGETLEKAE